MILQFLVVVLGVGIVIGIIVQCVRSAFGPQYIKCDCGNKCKVSNDGRFYWECDRCGRSGRAKPFKEDEK